MITLLAANTINAKTVNQFAQLHDDAVHPCLRQSTFSIT